ncbi:MAG TPA: GNAT family N-acetyltransferase [Terriglobales bacterium]|nr:GNAT family N-acetyltransferase [Terriglobales bacterium]
MSLRAQLITSAGDREHAFAIRREVFIDEQRVQADEEFDEYDATATHVLAFCDGEPAGTGRVVFHSGWAKIGRMAVRARYRRRGVGRAILTLLIETATRRGYSDLRLHAQTRAIPFYEALGFCAFGEEFDEAGIPHRAMHRGR